MDMSWIKKYVKESREVENLHYIIKMVPNLVPPIKAVTSEYYIIEKCTPIQSKDFEPSSFYGLCTQLLTPLHGIKVEHFTPGVYKYFAPHCLGGEIKGYSYIPYITGELEGIARCMRIKCPELLNDALFTSLCQLLSNRARYLKDWEPSGGYSLLHGDLHVGNIVKRERDFLFIDFEYLRYGAAELEVANLINSCITYHHKGGLNEQEVMRLNKDYARVAETLPLVDPAVLNFFLVFSLTLFFISSYLRGEVGQLEIVRQLARYYNTPHHLATYGVTRDSCVN